jgi:hypothetical protein
MNMQCLTANRLHDGAVVFRRADGQWSRAVHDAFAFQGDGKAELDAASLDVAAALVVGVEAIDVTITDKGPEPVSLREKIRAFGPTV